jgi:cytoskeletal protein RodZ
MARDELDLSDYRSSRVPRVLMIVSALAVMLVGAWFLAPVLLARYSKATTTAAFSQKNARVDQPQAPATTMASAAPTAADNAAPAPVTTATATRNDDNPSAPAAWPTDTPPAWPGQPASAAPAAPPPAQPAASAPPAPAANAEPIQLASAAAAPPADTNADTAVNADTAANPDLPANVPLPRSRPSRQIAARLAIPLPRPRPEIDSDVQTPELRAFELQVERMR